MNTIVYEILGLAQKLLPIVLTILFASAAFFSLMGKAFKEKILAEDLDGLRLFKLGFGVIALSLLADTGTRMVAFATFGATILIFGWLIWMKDSVTAKLLRPGLGVLYLVVAAGIYAYGAFWGAEHVSFNAIGFKALAIPVGSAVLLGSLTAFSFLSEQFKERILPQNADGVRLMTYAVIALVVTLFSTNPVVLVAMATFCATWLAFGLLIALPEWLTKALLKTWLWPVYAILAAAIFYGSVDFFTTTFVTGALMFGLSIPMAAVGAYTYAQTKSETRNLLTNLAPSSTYLAIGAILMFIAGMSLLIG